MPNNVVSIPYLVTGAKLYATIRDRNGKVWNGSSFEVYATANLANYDVALTEQGTASKIYAFTFPAGITTVGDYKCAIYVYAVDGIPAETDAGPVWLEDLYWDGDSLASGAEEVWSYGTRTLTQTGASLAAVVDGTSLTLHRGDTLSLSLTGVGNISSRNKLWWAWKDSPNRPDSESQLYVEETLGLVYVGGSTPTTGQSASITVTNATTGNLTITVSAAAMAALSAASGTWELQMLSGSTVTTLQSGTVEVTSDVVLATS
jgi:hypothetical protein